MIRNLVSACVLLAFVSFSSELLAQQTVPGTSLISAPVPSPMPNATDPEVLWAFEDYVRDTMALNSSQSISVSDMVAVIADFTSNTGRNPRCPNLDDVITDVNSDPATYDQNGNKQFTDSDIDSIAVSAGLNGDCDDPGGGYVDWGDIQWPVITINGDVTCIQFNSVTSICNEEGR